MWPFERHPTEDPSGPDEIVMEVDELVMRHASGTRFRLVRLLYTRPETVPQKIDGQWPLILEACWASDPGPPEVLIVTEETQRYGECFGAIPGDRLIVTPAPTRRWKRSSRRRRRRNLMDYTEIEGMTDMPNTPDDPKQIADSVEQTLNLMLLIDSDDYVD